MLTVRPFNEKDADAVKALVAQGTLELRAVYAPRPIDRSASPSHPQSPSRVVAVDAANTVVGVAEYIERASSIHVQGIAVASTHRRAGVARRLLAYIASLAADNSLPELELATVKETGNVDIFRRLGFVVSAERISERFLDSDGMPVTEVTLKRKAP